jgi:predicted metal-dependent peptidase
VSGSISDVDLQYFFSTINRFFKYGVEKIDVVTFDTALGEPMTLSKARNKIVINGRGGTWFQPVVNFVADHPEYDGLIIFTDGYASKPEVSAKLKGRILWILRSEKEYKDHRNWMKESGRVCFIENR